MNAAQRDCPEYGKCGLGCTCFPGPEDVGNPAPPEPPLNVERRLVAPWAEGVLKFFGLDDLARPPIGYNPAPVRKAQRPKPTPTPRRDNATLQRAADLIEIEAGWRVTATEAYAESFRLYMGGWKKRAKRMWKHALEAESRAYSARSRRLAGGTASRGGADG